MQGRGRPRGGGRGGKEGEGKEGRGCFGQAACERAYVASAGTSFPKFGIAQARIKFHSVFLFDCPLPSRSPLSGPLRAMKGVYWFRKIGGAQVRVFLAVVK
jgi:hypothetical protein